MNQIAYRTGFRHSGPSAEGESSNVRHSVRCGPSSVSSGFPPARGWRL